MATLTVQQIALTGLEATYSAATATTGDKFTPGDTTFIDVVNGGGSDITATITTPNTSIGGAAIADLAITVTAGERRHIGPFPREHFADPSDGLAKVVCSAVTSVTIAALKI
jgi:hypothetical protein